MREDWVEFELNEVFNIATGNTPSKKDIANYGGEIPFVKPPNLWNGLVTKTQEFLTEKGAKKSRVLPPFSTLVTCIGNLGRVALNKKEVAFNQQINGIKPTIDVNPFFTFYQVQSPHFKLQLEKKSSATTVAIVNKGNFETIKFNLAPLPEQRAIVTKIEELFSSLDSGIADLKKAQEQLKIYRQAVLKKAFEGELTNIKNIRTVAIGDVCELNPKLANKSEVCKELELQFLPMKLVEEIINKIHLTEIRKFSDVQNKSYTYFADGDVLFAKVTPCMENGKIAIAHSLKNGIGYGSSEFHVFRCTDQILNSFLCYYIVQENFRRNAQSAMTGAVGLRRVPKKYLEDHSIPLPSIKEQHQIILEIESRLSVCDKVEESIVESLEKSKALRQSILKKAFEGKLLNDAEIAACKSAPDYEPASVLLKRIKAEKATGVKNAAVKKKK